MIYTENTRKAMKIAYNAHMGQEDKSGVPYIYYPIHLAEHLGKEEEWNIYKNILIIMN